ncbi:hypothetical protein SLEP1_g1309 [Rubroshorea leprosula]|uniref:Uncharacterized protein n=1 Tax=Rubroshorea leprosula TaxID=152421 RepID=A0AAV5HMH4_9ROSI|nr:hypothetical protein SLEP1_g1309 [Rubroshorea leprosula]
MCLSGLGKVANAGILAAVEASELSEEDEDGEQLEQGGLGLWIWMEVRMGSNIIGLWDGLDVWVGCGVDGLELVVEFGLVNWNEGWEFLEVTLLQGDKICSSGQDGELDDERISLLVCIGLGINQVFILI